MGRVLGLCRGEGAPGGAREETELGDQRGHGAQSSGNGVSELTREVPRAARSPPSAKCWSGVCEGRGSLPEGREGTIPGGRRGPGRFSHRPVCRASRPSEDPRRHSRCQGAEVLPEERRLRSHLSRQQCEASEGIKKKRENSRALSALNSVYLSETKAKILLFQTLPGGKNLTAPRGLCYHLCRAGGRQGHVEIRNHIKE